jgi:serine/threonine protein kinase
MKLKGTPNMIWNRSKSIYLNNPSPEILLESKQIGSGTDIWSLAAIIYFIITGRDLFDSIPSSPLAMIERICSKCGDFPDDEWNEYKNSSLARFWNRTSLRKNKIYEVLSEDLEFLNSKLVDLLAKMLARKPSERLTAEQCLQHPFFDDYDENSFLLRCNFRETSRVLTP